MSEAPTWAWTVRPSGHCADSQQGRDISHEELQKAVKDGHRHEQLERGGRLMFTCEDIAYITSPASRQHGTTAWRRGMSSVDVEQAAMFEDELVQAAFDLVVLVPEQLAASADTQPAEGALAGGAAAAPEPPAEAWRTRRT